MKDFWSQTSGRKTDKAVILCDRCSQKLRVPKGNKKLNVTCPRCRHTFKYRHQVLKISMANWKAIAIGLVGGLVGVGLVELLNLWRLPNAFLSTAMVTAGYGLGLGAVMGAAEGYLRQDKARMWYGLKLGIGLGGLSGLLSGFLAQAAYIFVLYNFQPYNLGLVMTARVIGWSVLGVLMGGSYGIKENTQGDLKVGLIGGGIGGIIGGLLFDPIGLWLGYGADTVARILGFTVLGISVSLAIRQFRDNALRHQRPDMFQPLTRKLPSNPRLSLGPANAGSAAPESKARVEALLKVLVNKCLGDMNQAQRLVQYECDQNPSLSPEEAIQAAIRKWEKDNR